MVLEEASLPADSFASTDSPASDTDPYASYSNTSNGSRTTIPLGPGNPISVDLNTLPHPFALLGTAQQPELLTTSIQDSCRFAAQVLGRPATQQEADAFAFHAAKTFRIASFGSPVGVAMATVQWYRTMSSFRFPGYSPFKDQSRWSADSFLGFQGRQARIMWHGSRLGAYWLLGSTLGQIFFGSYAVSVSLAGRAMDPRLRDFTEGLRKMQREGRDVRELRRQQDRDGTTQDETFEMRRQRRAVQGMARESQQGAVDDMSPTGGAFGNDLASGEGGGGMMSDAQLGVQQARQDSEHRAAEVAEPTQRATPPQRPSGSRPSSPSSTSSQPQSGSVWERLRQQAAAGAGSTSQSASNARPPSSSITSEQRQGSTLGDSFAFSDSDEERQTGRVEAQREFNARMERERQGKDFEETRSGGKRW